MPSPAICSGEEGIELRSRLHEGDDVSGAHADVHPETLLILSEG